eukprot:1157504-Rhodomonas_salina.2
MCSGCGDTISGHSGCGCEGLCKPRLRSLTRGSQVSVASTLQATAKIVFFLPHKPIVIFKAKLPKDPGKVLWYPGYRLVHAGAARKRGGERTRVPLPPELGNPGSDPANVTSRWQLPSPSN